MADRVFQIILKAQDQASKVVENFGRTVAKDLTTSLVGTLGAITSVGFAFSKLSNFVTSSISEATKAESVQNALAQAIRNTGQAVNDVLPKLQSQAKAIQAASTFDDETVANAQRILVSIGRLRGEVLERATQAAADFAANTGKPIEEVVAAIAKAATGSGRALQKFVGNIKDAKGNAASFDTVLGTLETRFRGSASASVESLDGKLVRLSNTWVDFKETLGGSIAPLDAVKGGVDALTLAIERLNRAQAKGNEPGERGFWEQLGLTLKAGGAFNPSAAMLGAGGDLGTAAQLVADQIAGEMRDKQLAKFAVKPYVDPAALALIDKQLAATESRLSAEAEAADKAAKSWAALREKIPGSYEAPRAVTGERMKPEAFVPPASYEGIEPAAIAGAGAEKIRAAGTAMLELLQAAYSVDDALARTLDTMSKLDGTGVGWTADLQAATEAMFAQAAAVESMQTSYDLLANSLGMAADALWELATTGKVSISGLIQAISRQVFATLTGIAIEDFIRAMEQAAMATAAFASGNFIGGAAHAVAAGQFKASSLKAAGGAAAALAIGAVASRFEEGGLVRGPSGRDKVPAWLTAGESVLTRPQTQLLMAGRAAIVPAGAGSGGMVVHLTVNAADADGVRRLFENNPEAIAAGLARAIRRGYIATR